MSTATEKSKMEQLNAMVHEFGRPDVQIAADEEIFAVRAVFSERVHPAFGV